MNIAPSPMNAITFLRVCRVQTEEDGTATVWQAGIWILWAFALGAIHAMASFLPVMLERGNLGSPDLHRVLYGVALVYGARGLFRP